jgi:hypothetical protein
MERVKGIEPSSQPWEGHILPLNHTRFESDVAMPTLIATAQDSNLVLSLHGMLLSVQ